MQGWNKKRNREKVFAIQDSGYQDLSAYQESLISRGPAALNPPEDDFPHPRKADNSVSGPTWTATGSGKPGGSIAWLGAPTEEVEGDEPVGIDISAGSRIVRRGGVARKLDTCELGTYVQVNPHRGAGQDT